jgi:hypothetical protein
VLAGDTLPGDDYLLAPFTAADVAQRVRWLTRYGSSFGGLLWLVAVGFLLPRTRAAANRQE